METNALIVGCSQASRCYFHCKYGFDNSFGIKENLYYIITLAWSLFSYHILWCFTYLYQWRSFNPRPPDGGWLQPPVFFLKICLFVCGFFFFLCVLFCFFKQMNWLCVIYTPIVHRFTNMHRNLGVSYGWGESSKSLVRGRGW